MYRRIVVKIGTKVLTDGAGSIDEQVLECIVAQIASRMHSDTEVVLVSSGAVGSGRGLIALSGKKETIADKQCYAAVGQVRLMETYAALFQKESIVCAQVLVTKEDFRDRNHYHNMRRCFQNLLRDGVIPIVNENDVVAIKELVFTDNDELAGLVATQLEADAVVILTSVDGVLTGSPQSPAATVIPKISLHEIDAAAEHISADISTVGRGGMKTKFRIAKNLMSSGIAVHIANGRADNIITRILAGEQVGTMFVPEKQVRGMKRRLAYADGLAIGAIVVNKRAGEMLMARTTPMSLLPVGVTSVEGDFKKGDVIEVWNDEKKRIGYGVSACAADEARKRAGAKGARPVIHYDYLYIE